MNRNENPAPLRAELSAPQGRPRAGLRRGCPPPVRRRRLAPPPGRPRPAVRLPSPRSAQCRTCLFSKGKQIRPRWNRVRRAPRRILPRENAHQGRGAGGRGVRARRRRNGRTRQVKIEQGLQIFPTATRPTERKIGRGKSRTLFARGRNSPWFTPRVHRRTFLKPRRVRSATMVGVGP